MPEYEYYVSMDSDGQRYGYRHIQGGGSYGKYERLLDDGSWCMVYLVDYDMKDIKGHSRCGRWIRKVRDLDELKRNVSLPPDPQQKKSFLRRFLGGF